MALPQNNPNYRPAPPPNSPPPGSPAAGGHQPPSRKARRSARERVSSQAREARWNSNRLSIPYATDGPKVTFGILWFILVMAAAQSGGLLDKPIVSKIAIAILIGPIAGLAGLQAGNAWFGPSREVRSWSALTAYVLAVSGFVGLVGVGAGLGLAFVLLLIAAGLGDGSTRSFGELFDVLFRTAVPAGLAVASMAAIASLESEFGGNVGAPALIALVLMVSAYEIGDFLVGSGANNAIEGPLSGMIALVVGPTFYYFLVPPAVFPSATSVLLFGGLTAICCPLGQMIASTLLPQSTSWAPALRRLDSYIVAAPLWLLLLSQFSF